MSKNSLVLLTALCLTTFGLVTAIGSPSVTRLSDSFIDSLYVGGTNEACHTPEPDCPEESCHDYGSNQCHSLDDYYWRDDNHCDSATGKKCDLSDNIKCYDETICTRAAAFKCSDDGSTCYRGQNCSTTTKYRYDTCKTCNMPSGSSSASGESTLCDDCE